MARHYKRPKIRGVEGTQTHKAEVHNRVCGDKIKLAFSFDAQGNLVDIFVATEGCMMCTCSASIMADWMLYHGTLPLQLYPERILALLRNEEVDLPDALDVQALRSLADFPARHNCVTLPWKALEKALQKE